MTAFTRAKLTAIQQLCRFGKTFLESSAGAAQDAGEGQLALRLNSIGVLVETVLADVGGRLARN